jgi:hypothetical protein
MVLNRLQNGGFRLTAPDHPELRPDICYEEGNALYRDLFPAFSVDNRNETL